MKEVRLESYGSMDVEMARSVHRVIGPNGDGYCQTYGSSTPHSLVYPLDPSAPNSIADLIKNTEEVTEKVTKEVTERVTKEVSEKVTKEMIEKVKADVSEELSRQFAKESAQLKAYLMSLKSTNGISADPQVQSATSVDQRESVGDELHILTPGEEPIATKEQTDKGNEYECSEIAGAGPPAPKKIKLSDGEEVSSVLRGY